MDNALIRTVGSIGVMTYRYPSTAYRILLALYDENKRFSELTEDFPKATVAKLLPELEKQNLVERHVTNKRPLQVSYTITDDGKKVLVEGVDDALKIIRSSIDALKQVDPKVPQKIRIAQVQR